MSRFPVGGTRLASRVRLLVRALVIVPLALCGALTLVDHGWTLWNEVRLTEAVERAEARLVETPVAADVAVDVLEQELVRSGVPSRHPQVDARRSDGSVHLDVRVPWHGLFAAVPHRSELRRTVSLPVDRG